MGGKGDPVISSMVASFLRGDALNREVLSFRTALSPRRTCESTSFTIVTAPAGCSRGGGCFSASDIRTTVASIEQCTPGT